MEQIICADSLSQAGLPESLLQLDFASRYFVMGMVPQDAKSARKPKKEKLNHSVSHVTSSTTFAAQA
ncbi:hypothetical protein HAP94_14005 [Acidithiobacillus ferrivorans]|nr:hypothetical protein [Acidithiobacillus ferrivorans]